MLCELLMQPQRLILMKASLGGYLGGGWRTRAEKMNQPCGCIRTEDDGVIGVNTRVS